MTTTNANFAKLVSVFAAAIAANKATADNVKKLAPEAVAPYIGKLAKADMLKALKTLAVTDATWPTKDGAKVGEKAARSSAAGKAYNACQAWVALYIAPDGKRYSEDELAVNRAQKTLDKATKTLNENANAGAEKVAAVTAARAAVVAELTDEAIVELWKARHGKDNKSMALFKSLLTAN